MAIQGLINTDDFGGTLGSPDTIPGFERPTNWRQGILMRYPNGHAPITALTSVMKKKVTDDPQYQWWEREVSNLRFRIADSESAIVDETPSTWDMDSDPYGFTGVEQLKIGDMLMLETPAPDGTQEICRVTAVAASASPPTITVARGWGGTDRVAVADVTAAHVNQNLILVGSAFEEGADTPDSVRYRAAKKYNYTQIFRDSLKATRTAMQTRLRTVDEVRDAKQQCLLYHSIRMEYAFMFGVRHEVAGSAAPIRTTGGIIRTIEADASANVIDVDGTALKMEKFEEYMLEAFRFGSQEKMCFCGNRALMGFVQMARRNASIEITPVQKEFGMDIRRFFTPFGTLVMKTHPLFNQVQSQYDSSDIFRSLDSWALILDMGDISYRPLRNSDTQYLPDRQANGVDGLTSEYLTECGLEVHHGKHHTLLKGVDAGAADA